MSVSALAGTVYKSSGNVIRIRLLLRLLLHLLIITTTILYALRYGHILFLSEFSTDRDVVLPLSVFIVLSFP
jgi:hypothetical protein